MRYYHDYHETEFEKYIALQSFTGNYILYICKTICNINQQDNSLQWCDQTHD